MKKIKLWKWTNEGDIEVEFEKCIVKAYVKIKFDGKMTLKDFLENEYDSIYVNEIENMIKYVKNEECWK